ncbi:hypothetical protein ACFYM7_35885 [Streptomyces cyaneofuscatus]|uniref:hypothetical protein n=1 Tax=Streptomyces cyaneofuscatus TaxID=66883 RepID=UPI0036CE0A00
MPSLNITFTDAELEAVRAAAAAEGKSLKQFVHDLPLREQQRVQFVHYAAAWGEGHRNEFDDAFPDEIPPPDRQRADAA